MENLSERVAYLKGLAEGMKIDQATNEGKLLISIIDVLGEVSESINEIEEAHLQLNEQVEDIDEDLALGAATPAPKVSQQAKVQPVKPPPAADPLSGIDDDLGL